VEEQPPRTPTEPDYSFQGLGSAKNGPRSRFGSPFGSPFSPGWGKKKRPTTSYFPEPDTPYSSVPGVRYSDDQAYTTPTLQPYQDQFKASNPFKPATADGASNQPSFPQALTTPTPKFETHFDSDFDPLAPPVSTPPPHRLSLSMPKIPPSNSSKPPSPLSAASSPKRMEPRDPTPFSRSDSFVPTHRTSNSTPAASTPDFSSRSRPPVQLETKKGLREPLTEGIGRAIALFDFHAQEAGDLSFAKGDVLVILKKSGTSEDWWTGKINGRQGIFPANFVEVV